MHDLIEIGSPNERVVIDPNGAWVTRLEDNQRAIFFPKTTLVDATGAEKTRGGMHVCLPNFGPDSESGLAQHGFGRTSVWTVLQHNESSATLELEITKDDYAGLTATLVYTLAQGSLNATLSLANKRDRSLRVAPGFHPYFALEKTETTVVVNGKTYRLNELAGTEFITANTATLRTEKHDIAMVSENLTAWAIWTDLLGNYVCIEPTFGGNRFLDAERSDEALAPSQTRTYSIRILW